MYFENRLKPNNQIDGIFILQLTLLQYQLFSGRN